MIYDKIKIKIKQNSVSWKKLLRYFLTSDILDEKYTDLYKRHKEHKIFPFPPSLIVYLNELGFKVRKVCFIKGFLSKIHFLRKFSDYIGIVAEKK